MIGHFMCHTICRGFRWLPAIAACCLIGCWRASEHEVVVYTAFDAEFSEPILEKFQQQERVVVLSNFDVESTKTVGLVTRIIREKDRPRCDLFWNNEILHTLRLQKQGLLRPYDSPAGRQFPAGFRSPGGFWYGFAARARILIVNTKHVPSNQRPQSLLDLTSSRWKGRVGIAKPLFGTTATHAAVLFAYWGPKRATAFFQQLKDNVQIMGGNRQVAQAVARGELDIGLTDTDDANVELRAGSPVAIVYPDQQEGGMGTLLIPNTLCIIRGGRHAADTEKLMEYLLSPEVETVLAKGPSAQFPINPAVSVRPALAAERPVRWMDVDFQKAADLWDTAAPVLRTLFASGR